MEENLDNVQPKMVRNSISQQGEQINQEEDKYDLAEVTISKEKPEPVQIDGEKEIVKFLQSGILKGIENPKIRERFIKSIMSKRVSKLLKISFYFIFASNYPECLKFDEEDEISQNLKKKLSKNYVKLFSSLPQPKDEIVNMIIFCLGYINHYLFYQLFPKQRDLFDLRFVFNCYHILVFEFNGIFVSDFFIRMNIDKIFFQNKFLDYERVNKKNLLLQQQAKNKFKNKTFFGFQLNFPEINTYDGQAFTRQMQDKFKPAKKNFSNLLEDPYTSAISAQDKQAKIKNSLKEKRIKEIEENELKKIRELLTVKHTQHEQGQGQEFQPTHSLRTIQLMNIQQKADDFEQKDKEGNQVEEKELSLMQKNLLFSQQMAMKLVQEKAEEIFEKTQLKNEESKEKEEQNYFANLQLNCNQISPTISDILAYDNRTLPYAKKKMIRHAFETVNDKEDNLLNQLKQFSQSRKQKKETKNTHKTNKSIIDHFGLRPPPREYYQKHPKLDKMFKDMLDLNYVLKMNQESMNQLPSSIHMNNEILNEWQTSIAEQEMNYNKQNQRQKVQDNLQEVLLSNQQYQLEKRPGYRKNYIYTKPLQYMKKNLSANNLQNNQQAVVDNRSITPAKIGMTATAIATAKQNNPKMLISEPITAFQSQSLIVPAQQQQLQSMLNQGIKLKKEDNSALPANQLTSVNTQSLTVDKSSKNMTYFPNIEIASFQHNDENARFGSQVYNTQSSLIPSPQKYSNQSAFMNFSYSKQGEDSILQKSKKSTMSKQVLENSAANHRTIQSIIHEVDTKGNKRGYYEEDNESMEQKILKNKQNNEFYNGKQRMYQEKYKGLFNTMNTDKKIDNILQNILIQRNQFNRNLKSKIKNL